MNARIACVVFGITLLVTMGISSLIPVLPLLAQTFGVPQELSGLVIAAFALPGLACIPLAGVLSDRYGRKAVLMPALCLFTLGGMGCMFCTTFAELLSCRVIQGIGAAPLGILYNTIIADTWTDEPRVHMMSYNAMALGIGTAISPALGGSLAFFGWQMPFALSFLAVPVLALTAGVSLMRPNQPASFKLYLNNVFSCLRARPTLRLLALSLLTSILLFGPVVTCFPLLASARFAANAFDIGIIMAAPSLVSGLAAWRLASLFSRTSPRVLLFTSLALYALALLFMPFISNLWWLVLPLLFFGFAQGLNIPLSAFLLTGQAPPEQRAALMATNAICLRLAQFIAPLVFSGLAVHFGIVFALLSALVVVGVMATLVAKI